MTLAGNSLHEDDTRRGLKKESARQTGWAWVMKPYLSMSEGDAEWGEHLGDSECRGQR